MHQLIFYLGKLGFDSLEASIKTPRLISGLSNVRDISCGRYHSLFLTSEGRVYSCGNNEYGNLGLGTISRLPIPRLISVLSNVREIACGYLHSLFLTSEGRVYSCGSNWNGQLGLGTGGEGTKETSPTLITNVSNVREIACGYDHSILICG